MQQKTLEPISALMDGEVEAFELRRLVERAASDDDVSEKWRRYHLAQDVMKGRDVCVNLSEGFSERVSRAIDQEPSYTIKDMARTEEPALNKKSAENQWFKPLASMAVAASVTAVVILGGQQLNQAPEVVLQSQVADAGLPQVGNQNLIQAQYATPVSVSPAPLVAYGMQQYIEKYKDVTESRPGEWAVSWMPQGFEKISHRVTKQAELMHYSNGTEDLTINVEPLGAQVATQGVLNKGDLIALGKKVENNFITVVGPLSQEVAEKIASSVAPNP